MQRHKVKGIKVLWGLEFPQIALGNLLMNPKPDNDYILCG